MYYGFYKNYYVPDTSFAYAIEKSYLEDAHQGCMLQYQPGLIVYT